MGLVLYALKFRITTYVLAVLMMLGGVGAIVVMPKDVLPVVDIPVVVVVWTYTGLSTPEMEQRITTYAEYGISNNVNNIRRMESTTLQGTAVQRVYFDPAVSIDLAIARSCPRPTRSGPRCRPAPSRRSSCATRPPRSR